MKDTSQNLQAIGGRGGGVTTPDPCTTDTSETEEVQHLTLSSLRQDILNGLSYI